MKKAVTEPRSFDDRLIETGLRSEVSFGALLLVLKKWREQTSDELNVVRLESFRKEVIQPQVPLRLPCYDLVPITKFALGTCLPKVSTATLGAPRFRGLTGGVYKAQEHIHRSIADLRLLAIPAS